LYGHLLVTVALRLIIEPENKTKKLFMITIYKKKQIRSTAVVIFDTLAQ
jgi:hypothetical protein